MTSRLIDRPIRPLFPDGFKNEVQVVCDGDFLNAEVDADIPAMLASAALAIAECPSTAPSVGPAWVIATDSICSIRHAPIRSSSQLELVVAERAMPY